MPPTLPRTERTSDQTVDATVVRSSNDYRRQPTPRTAELVAARLRERILSGQMADGSVLPNQERLVEEFRVSKQALREGLRILELEGLITVLRGNTGGALVHLPSPTESAYSLSLILQSRHVHLDQVGAALMEIEPICVRLCAERENREATVVAQLRAAHQETLDSVDDLTSYLRATSNFHRALAANCGNEPLAVLAGSLETIWLAHVRLWAEEEERYGRFPAPNIRLGHGIAEHAELIELIADGAVDQAVALDRRHMVEFYSLLVFSSTEVRATTLNDD